MAKKQFRTKYDYIPISKQVKVIDMGYYSGKRRLSRLFNIAWLIGCMAVGYELIGRSLL